MASGPHLTRTGQRPPFITVLSASDRQALLAAGHRRRWSRGEAIIRAGDVADTACLVLDGEVKIYTVGSDGAEAMLALCGAGDLLGEACLLVEPVRSVCALALTDVSAVTLSTAQLRQTLAEHPEIALALLQLTLGRLYAADGSRLESATHGALARVAGRLVELAERFGSTGPDDAITVEMPVSQEDLASWSACSRESTARALRTLRELHVIATDRMRMSILDPDALRRHSAR